MPHMQMHVGGAEGLCGNIVRLIHKPHSHIQSVLPIEHTFSCGQHQGQHPKPPLSGDHLALRAIPGGFAVVQRGAPSSPGAW